MNEPSERLHVGSGPADLGAPAGLDCPGLSGTPASEHSISVELGRSVVGPLCHAFSCWLANRAREAGISHLFFLSRDGWLLKKAFELLPESARSGVTTHYLYSSRRAVWFASLQENTPDAEFNEMLSGASPYLAVKKYLSRVFIEPDDYLPQIKAVGFENADSVVTTDADRRRLYALLKSIRPHIVQNAAEERRDYLAYLKQSGLLSQQKTALVDVGWTGSILKYTQRLVREAGAETKLYGYFIGVGANASKKYGFSKGDCLHGFLFDFEDKQHSDIRRHFYLIEKFLSPPEPSLIRIKSEDSGELRPVFAASQPEESPLVAVVQQSALQYVAESADRNPSEATDVERFLPALKRLLNDPSPDVARFLGNYSYSFDFGYQNRPSYYAKSEALSFYLRQPLRLLKDYRRALWKPGFLAQQPLPARVVLKCVGLTRLDSLFEQAVYLRNKARS